MKDAYMEPRKPGHPGKMEWVEVFPEPEIYWPIGYGPQNLIPFGTILGWRGGNIPNGWQVCDGTNGTPDLRDDPFLMTINARYIMKV